MLRFDAPRAVAIHLRFLMEVSSTCLQADYRVLLLPFWAAVARFWEVPGYLGWCQPGLHTFYTISDVLESP